MKLELFRDIFGENYTLGELMLEGKHYSWTCEDKDRRLEDAGNESAKVFGETAIPRGTYKLHTVFSPHFKRVVVELQDVSYFTKVYLHGGNRPEDSLGCILHGKRRSVSGPSYISDCAERVATLEKMVDECEERGEECSITVS